MLCEGLVSRCPFVEPVGLLNGQAVPNRPIVRGEQRTIGSALAPEETDVAEDVHEVAHSADDRPLLALIPLFHGRKRDLGLPLILCRPGDHCACHVEHV
jgi:hypothetical protein